MKTARLTTMKTADVSTRYITAKDSHILAELGNDEYGAVLIIVNNLPHGYRIHIPAEPNYLVDVLADATKAGLSTAFCNLIKLCHEEDCAYLVLDSDGADVEGLPEFDW